MFEVSCYVVNGGDGSASVVFREGHVDIDELFESDLEYYGLNEGVETLWFESREQAVRAIGPKLRKADL